MATEKLKYTTTLERVIRACEARKRRYAKFRDARMADIIEALLTHSTRTTSDRLAECKQGKMD